MQTPEQNCARRAFDGRVDSEADKRDASSDRTAQDCDGSFQNVPTDRQIFETNTMPQASFPLSDVYHHKTILTRRQLLSSRENGN
jgi:hypothetical protein